MARCVVFDFDGTLVDSNAIKHDTFYEVTDAIPGASRELDELFAQGHKGPREAIFADLIARMPDRFEAGDETVQKMVREYTDTCERRIAACPEMPGASGALRRLKDAGSVLYISSATPQQTLVKTVGLRDLSGYFEDVFGYPTTKAQVLRRLSEDPGNTVVMVGDKEADRAAALEVDCPFVAVLNSDNDFFLAPRMAVADLGQLPDMIETLFTDAVGRDR